jgi:hypothetical protein
MSLSLSLSLSLFLSLSLSISPLYLHAYIYKQIHLSLSQCGNICKDRGHGRYLSLVEGIQREGEGRGEGKSYRPFALVQHLSHALPLRATCNLTLRREERRREGRGERRGEGKGDRRDGRQCRRDEEIIGERRDKG